MDIIGNAENSAGGEAQFLQDLRRNLPSRLYKIGFATGATAVGGLLEHIVVVAAASPDRQPEGVPLPHSIATFFILLVTLAGALGTIYAGRRVEQFMTPRWHNAGIITPRWHNAGIIIYFLCFLLLLAAVGLVGSADYCDLALNLIDN